MAQKTDLMSGSLPWEAASRLGFDAPALTVASAGSTQLGATVLTSNFSIVTSGSGGVIISGRAPNAVINISGSNCTVYPPVGGFINGLSVNTGLIIGNNKQALIENSGLYYIMILSA